MRDKSSADLISDSMLETVSEDAIAAVNPEIVITPANIQTSPNQRNQPKLEKSQPLAPTGRSHACEPLLRSARQSI